MSDSLQIMTIIVYFLFRIIGLFILSLIIYYALGLNKKLKDKYLLRSIIAVTPIIVIGLIILFVDKLRLSYFSIAVIIALFLLLLSKVNQKVIRIILILLMFAFLFPKPAGNSGFMSKRGYSCSCIGVKDTVTGIDTYDDICYGVPLMCAELDYATIRLPHPQYTSGPTATPTPEWMANPIVSSHSRSIIPGHEMRGFGYYFPKTWKQVSDGHDITNTTYDTGIPISISKGASIKGNYLVYIDYYSANTEQKSFPSRKVPSQTRTVNAQNGDYVGLTLAPFYADQNNANDVLANKQLEFIEASLKFANEDGSY